MRDFGLTAYDAGVLVADRQTADFFEAVAEKEPANAKMAAKWVINELFGRLNKEGLEIDESPVKADQLSEVLDVYRCGHDQQ